MPDVEPAIEEDNSHLGQWKSIDLENREESSIPLNASRENPFFILFLSSANVANGGLILFYLYKQDIC